jgi:DNA-binding response OmpR family regulator/phenylpyruvate tautomerase PptA (4-oxalocrotonate tautomerase family)
MPYITVDGPPLEPSKKEVLVKELTQAAQNAYEVASNHVVTIVNEVAPKASNKVLVIDDERGILELLEDWLGSKGYEVITASDGEDGLRKAQRENPAVIILDIMMPGIDGFEVLNKLRSSPKTQGKPVIMLTQKRETETIERAEHRGATDYIMKPFSVDDLLQMVRRYIACAK